MKHYARYDTAGLSTQAGGGDLVLIRTLAVKLPLV